MKAKAPERTMSAATESPTPRQRLARCPAPQRHWLRGALLLARRPVLLLDEPLAGLDAATRARVVECLLRRQGQGLLVIASHVALEAPAVRQRQLTLDEMGRPALRPTG